MQEIELNSIYRHFKGTYYYVKDIVFDADTLEECVTYQALYGEKKIWVRKVSNFLEEIDAKREDNVTKQRYRFELIKLDKGDQ